MKIFNEFLSLVSTMNKVGNIKLQFSTQNLIVIGEKELLQQEAAVVT